MWRRSSSSFLAGKGGRGDFDNHKKSIKRNSDLCIYQESHYEALIEMDIGFCPLKNLSQTVKIGENSSK